eukprot:CAMPEP_0202859998 /NCGR_PEP_ID=MMETSP1391-20130828/1888_1 /ASSEMBLY_ACC=CAM_ASM_000867 /TAXON_ID=1034604 /ORGANISM="Chlamydomonas leiostraca, Strain SAG 11-49" /LENGTH=374 /DNA_ID=CAMNT_0049539117 /DNA_START=65 /DNA_END=1189 /DNA_ORIENTATION=+
MARGSLLLLAAALLALAPAAVRAQAKKWSNALDFLQAQQDLRIISAQLSYFPYLQLALANPAFKGTVFCPSDKSLLASRPGVTAAQVIAEIKRSHYLSVSDLEMVTLWRTLIMHVVPNVTLVNSAFKRDMQLQPLYSRDTGDYISVRSTGPTVLGPGSRWVYNPETEEETLSDVKITRSVRVTPSVMVHVINDTFFSSVAPMDPYYLLPLDEEDRWSSYQKLANLSSHRELLAGPWAPFMEPRLTMLMPTDEAVAAFLESSGTSFEQLAANASALDTFVGAHILPAQGLWQWDLMNIAAINTTVTTLAGTQLRAVTDLESVWLVGAGGWRAQVTPKSDYGGNKAACAASPGHTDTSDYCGDYTSVGHLVARVLL